MSEQVLRNGNAMARSKTRTVTQIAMLGAIAGILMNLEFPLPFLAPTFYQLDFSEIPVLVGSNCHSDHCMFSALNRFITVDQTCRNCKCTSKDEVCHIAYTCCHRSLCYQMHKNLHQLDQYTCERSHCE